MEIIILSVAGLLLIILALFTGAAFGINRERAVRLEQITNEKETFIEGYINSLHAQLHDTEIERRLWVNSALVRGGSQRIFKTDEKPAKQSEHTTPNNAETLEMLPPYTSQVAQWRKEDAEKNKSIIPVDTKNEILEGIDKIAESDQDN